VSYTPVNSDATNVAAYTIARLNATSPSTVVATSDQAVAIADSYLGSLGYQTQSLGNALGAASTSSGTFADIGNGTTTGFAPLVWTAPITKTYTVDVDFVAFCSAITGAGDDVFFQLLIGGVAFWPNDGRQGVYTINQRTIRPHFTVPATFTAGVATTIKLQWKVNTPVSTVFNVDTACFRTFTVRG
jgi:hypothetical protein